MNKAHFINVFVSSEASVGEVLIEAVTKKYKQEVVTTPPSPLNTLARFMRKSSSTIHRCV
jgi:hypothetical protein